jgi:hypothetical protein
MHVSTHASHELQASYKGQDQAAQTFDNAGFRPTISTTISTAVRTLCRYRAVAQRGRPSREKELFRRCRRQTPLHAALSGDVCDGGGSGCASRYPGGLGEAILPDR